MHLSPKIGKCVTLSHVYRLSQFCHIYTYTSNTICDLHAYLCGWLVIDYFLTHADILNEPRIDSCNRTGHTMFVCRISNYSKYDAVVVVENDRILFNKSTKGLSFGCWPNVPDPSIATCTVNISHSGKASYKLCVGYNSSVPHKTKLQCSRDIIITSLNKSYGKD